MNQPVAIIDVDGVIYDYISKLAEIATIHLDRPREHFPPSTQWYFFEDWGFDKKEYFDLVDTAFSEYDLIKNGDPFPGAKEGWKLLQDNGVHIHVATACGGSGEPDAKLRQRARKLWLDAHGFEYDKITFTKDKASVAIKYIDRGCDVYSVDDSVENYLALRRAGAKSYLLTQEWNKELENAERVKNLIEFAYMVVEKRYTSYYHQMI